jgi:ribonuclease P/MRP protein subunit POP1
VWNQFFRMTIRSPHLMSSAPAQAAGQKRKSVTSSSAERKRQKTQDIRQIPVQSKDAAVSATGELDVASFVKAREYEINALEKSMQRSKKGLTTRAFQQVPRAMRRRTASHNVKKVPRRLRRRAEREVSGVHDQDSEPYSEPYFMVFEANQCLWLR